MDYALLVGMLDGLGNNLDDLCGFTGRQGILGELGG